MADSTFDIVSKVDQMEADNAVNQAQKEIATRYDFKNVGASVEWSGEKLLLKASAEERVKAVLEVVEQKFIKRGISLRSLDAGDPYASGKEYRIEIDLKKRHLLRGCPIVGQEQDEVFTDQCDKSGHISRAASARSG